MCIRVTGCTVVIGGRRQAWLRSVWTVKYFIRERTEMVDVKLDFH